MKKLFLKIWFWKRNKEIQRRNSTTVRRAFVRFCDGRDISVWHWHIHFIEVKTSENVIDVFVTLGRPGLMIGKGGQTLDALTDYLTRLLSKNVKIHIDEYDPFR